MVNALPLVKQSVEVLHHVSMQYCFHLYHRGQPSSQFVQIVWAIPDRCPFYSLFFSFTALHLTCSTAFVGPP